GGDDRKPRADAARDGDRARHAPVPEHLTEASLGELAALARAHRLDRRERGPADAAYVDRLDPEEPQALRDHPADPCAGLFRDHRHRTLADEPADRGIAPRRPGLPFRLHALLGVV